mmetsp:Transcript_20402/g.34165  ORF Transcript_20402/g.34165 Transcript_20402/m.34165 type:complete len:249 (-) Transcript_20402:405-1151(-)
MSHALIVIYVVFLSFGLVTAGTGVDLSVETGVDTWECLVQRDVSFAIIRAYRNVGEIDTSAARSIKFASSVGLKDLGAYIFPCIATSNYAVSNDITCKSAAQQFHETVIYLVNNDITFNQSGAYSLNRMWIDIEDESPNKYYDSDPAVNQAFIKEMVNAANHMKIPVGMYTTATYWDQIMNGTEDYSEKDDEGNYRYPLWYPRYDGEDSMDFYTPFAGWDAVQIKQTGGNVGWCNLTQVDSDYQESEY